MPRSARTYPWTNAMNQFKSQCESLMLARRWSKAVDFGSPMSAWTPEMLAAHRAANGQTQKIVLTNVRMAYPELFVPGAAA